MEKSLGPGSRFLGSRENKKKDNLSLTSQAVWKKNIILYMLCVFVYVVCLAGNEAKGAVQNRVRWRALVEELCSTRNEEE